jgi:hypothetical protein
MIQDTMFKLNLQISGLQQFAIQMKKWINV